MPAQFRRTLHTVALLAWRTVGAVCFLAAYMALVAVGQWITGTI
ncbi:hypothetical protein [Desulfobaculum senezii]|jgi:hypothetical protein